MKYDLDQFVERSGTNSAKWEAMAMMDPEADKTTLPFWVADMDFPCAEPILKALRTRVDKQIFGYTIHQTGEFFRSVCGWMQHRFDWYVDSKDIFLSHGVVPGFGYLFNIMTKPGDGILIQRPVYYPFTNMIESHQRKLINSALVYEDGKYSIDFDDFEKKVSDPIVKVFLLCHPHNPVGYEWTTEELRTMADLCHKYDVKIISDEIHFDLMRGGAKHIPLAKLCPEYKNMIVTCTAPSKTFNLAGIQLSNIIIHNKEIQEDWKKYVHGELGLSLMSPFAIEATQAAYYESEDWLEQVQEYLDGNLKMMKEFFAEKLPKIKFRIPDGTYLTWIDYKEYGLDREKFFKELVTEGKVLFEDGQMFGEEGSGFIRINVACQRALLRTALERLANIINRVRENQKAPDFEYDTPYEKNKNFYKTLEQNDKTYLIFLRYYGCTICQYELLQLKESYDEFKKKGITPIVVMQSERKLVNEALKDKGLPFEIICDPNQKLYELYSVKAAINMEDLLTPLVLDKIGKATQMGIVHGKYEGNEYQLPASFLIGNNGNVIFSKYSKSLDTSEMLVLD